ncbi:putative serine/threonine-protein kinase iks1 [Recurvomyces mirabilis]|nr:putative serine/threonine-protein kinase iks1 [Recurvomyces mirabilis]
MADDTPPRSMSLIPYPNDLEVVLRRGNAVVVYDTLSQQLQVRDATVEDTVDLTECPYCHRPYDDTRSRGRHDNPNAGATRGRTFSPERPYMNPEYFRMLAASQRATPNASGANTPSQRLFRQAALRSGRSRDVSGAQDPPPSGAQFVGSAPSTANAEGISSSAFSPGYFKQFFVEQGILGKGGNGVVMLVEHFMDGVSLGQFACKRIPVGNNHSWLEKVLVEIKLLQRLPHKNLVQYHWSWLEDHKPSRFGISIPCLWILQEYCNGGDLHNHVLGPREDDSTAETLKARARRKSKGEAEPPKNLRGLSRLTFEEIFSFFKDITSGLHHLHSKGYIHRDLKPSNCLLQHDGGKIRVLISDFGEVQAAEAKRGSTGATGTISYCAPEVLRQTADGTFGNFSTRSDIFSLGMIVYFMCFGRLPYSNADDINEENEDLDELKAEIGQWRGFDYETRARPDLPEQLYRFLRQLLSVDPDERPSTEDILRRIIESGGNVDEIGIDDSTSRISSFDSPSHRPSPPGRKQSAVLSRPGLSSLGRQRSGTQEVARSRSPIKTSAESHNGSNSRPLSPDDGAITVRPRKVELPPKGRVPTPQHSPRLMLPPPTERPVTNWLARTIHRPATIISFRVILFVLKLLILFVPCSPYAANAWILWPTIAVATLDLGLMFSDLRRSLLLLGLHLAAVYAASRSGYQCESPSVVWKDV